MTECSKRALNVHLSPWLVTSLHCIHSDTLSSASSTAAACLDLCPGCVYVVCRDGGESDEEEDDNSSSSSSSRSGGTRVRKAAERMKRDSPKALRDTRDILMRDAAKAIQR